MIDMVCATGIAISLAACEISFRGAAGVIFGHARQRFSDRKRSDPMHYREIAKPGSDRDCAVAGRDHPEPKANRGIDDAWFKLFASL